MFSRRLIRSSNSLGASAASLKAFTTSAPLLRVPALADVTPTGTADFEAKRKEFREKLAEANKPKKETGEFSVVNSHCSN